MESKLGQIEKCYRVSFKRRSAHPLARLWRAITDPDEVKAWMNPKGPVRVDLRPGGEYTIDFHGNGSDPLDGILVRIEAERRLAYVWGWSYVEWELEADGDGTSYTFVHNGLADRGLDSDEEGLPAGWHGFLGRFDDYLEGVQRTEKELEAEWIALKPSYRQQLDSILRAEVD